MLSNTTQHADEERIPFTAGDGTPLDLIHVRGSKPPTREPVLLVHGAGVRANIFRAPVRTTLVDMLLERGFDVWLENWRASIDYGPKLWTLDQAALYDHPQAVNKVCEQTGAERIKAVIHCQGSTSFAMSAVAGLVPQVEMMVSNAVSLHPVIPWWSRQKMKYFVEPVGLVMPYFNPHWGEHAPTAFAKLATALVRLTHRECDNAVCKMVSFTYGSGFPALWRHENLDDATHEWLKEEFGNVSVDFFRQMARCVDKGALVSYDKPQQLPADFTAFPPDTDARFALFAGEKNQCFLPESQRRTHAHLRRFRGDYDTLHVLPGYSHLDVFMGKRAAEDVFPLMIEELERGRGVREGERFTSQQRQETGA